MEAGTIVFGVISKGKVIYQILKFFLDNEIKMYAGEGDWSKTEDKVIFRADEKPLKSLFTQGFKDYHADKNHMDKFKEIEVIMSNREFYEKFLAKYHGSSPVLQKDLINYLKLVAEKFHDKYDLSMVITCLEKKTMWLEDGDSGAPHQTEKEVMALKLTFNVN